MVTSANAGAGPAQPTLSPSKGGAAPAQRSMIYAASAMMNFAGVIAMVALSYYAKAYLGATLMQLALMTFLGNAVYVALCPPLAALSELRSRRPFLVLGTLVFAAGYVGAFFSTQVWHLYIARCFAALGHALFWPAVEIELAAEADTHELRQRMGRFNISWSTGDIPGSLVAGIGLAVRPTLPFLLCAGTGVLISVLMAWARFAPATPDAQARHREAVDGHEVPPMHQAFWRMALVANFFSVGIISVVRGLFPDLAVDALHYTGLKFGVLAMMVAWARTGTFILLERHHGWVYRPRRFFAVQFLFPLACLLILFAHNFWAFALAFTFIGMGSGVVYFSSLYYSVHGASRQGPRAGIHEAVLGLGAGLVPFAAGPTRTLAEPYWREAIRAPYLLCAALSLLAVTVQFVIYSRALRRQAETQPPQP